MNNNSTLFIYLDPFGLKGCDFELIKSVLERGNLASTEVLINLSMPIFHRLAAQKGVTDGKAASSRIRSFHRILDKVFGGGYGATFLLTRH